MTVKENGRRLWQRCRKPLGFTLLGISGIVLLAIAGVCLLLFTEAGRVWGIHKGIAFANKGDIKIELEELNMPSLSQLKFANLTVRYRDQNWIEVQKLVFKWTPSALFDKTINIEQLAAGAITYTHRNLESNAEDKGKEPSGTFDLAKIPSIYVDTLALDKITVEHGDLSPDVDLPPSLNVNGKLKWPSGKLFSLQAQIESLLSPLLQIQLDADSNLAKQSLAMRMTLQEEKGGYLGKLIKTPLDDKIDAQLSLDLLLAESDIQLSQFQLETPLAHRKLTLKGAATISKDFKTIKLPGVDLQVDDTKHRFSGEKIADSIDLNFAINSFPLDILEPWSPHVKSGVVSASGNAAGPITALKASAKLKIDSAYQDIPFSATSQASYAENLLVIDRLNATVDKSDIAAKGRFNIATQTVNAKISSERFALGFLSKLDIKLPQELSAVLQSLKAEIRGPVKDPSGSLSVIAIGSYKGENFRADIDAKKQAEQIQVSTLKLKTDVGHVQASGDFNLKTEAVKATVDAKNISLALLELAGVELPQDLNAKASADISIAGQLKAPTGKASLDLAGQFKDIPFEFKGEAQYAEELVQLKNLDVLAFDQPVMKARGKADFETMDFTLSARKAPTKLLSAFGVNIQPGEFDADINASGPYKSPIIDGDLSYKAEFPAFDEQGNEVKLAFEWNLDLQAKDEEVLLVNNFETQHESLGQFKIRVPYAPYAKFMQNKKNDADASLPLAASIESNLHLQSLSFVLNPSLHRINGLLKGNIEISGQVDKPLVDGKLNLEQVSYENIIQGIMVSNTNCTFALDETRLLVQDCSAGDGGNGRYTVSGELDRPTEQNQGKIDLALKMKEVHLLRRPEIEGEATGTVELKGDFEDVLVKGDIEILPLNVYIDTNFSSSIPSIKVTRVDAFEESDGSRQQAPESRPKITLDIDIRAPRQAFLRGRGLEAEIKGEIDLRGTAQRPVYDGKFETIRGDMELFGKKFVIDRGVVTFANDAIDINISTVYEGKGKRIFARVTGSTDDFKLDLRAEPPMAEDQILAFIIFGKPVNKIEGPEAIQLASAVQKLRGGGGGFDPIGNTREALGLDTLRLETAEKENGESGGLSVGAGKYINERVYVEVKRSAESTLGIIEVQLRPNLHLETSSGGQSGQEGLELKWKRDY